MANKKTIFSLSTVAMVMLVIASIVTPLFLSYSKKSTVTPTDVKKFFSDEEIHKEWGQSYFITEHIPRKDIVFNLTNYSYAYDLNSLEFDQDNVNKNLLGMLKNQIIKEQKFFNDSNLYLQLRYRCISPKKLLIDSRWTNKNNAITLYYNSVSLDIDI